MFASEVNEREKENETKYKMKTKIEKGENF